MVDIGTHKESLFVYDGQTYEPTKFLVTGNGDAQNYRNATTKGRDAYANDSMAIDINREEVNSRIAEVEGGTPIDGYGETIGTAVATDGTKNDLHYKSGKVTSLQEPTRRVSELQTKTSEGLVYDVFKAKAGTKAA